MLGITFAWLICGFTFVTFGKLLINLCNIFLKNDGVYGFTATYFLGTCFVGTILSFLSIFLPINYTVGWVLFFISVLYTLYSYGVKRDLYWSEWFSRIKEVSLTVKLMIATVLVIIICCNLIPPFLTDMRLYYLQNILWNESYSVVPGLGNIHGRFGFNSNILLLASAFSFSNIFSVRIYAVVALSVFILISWILTKVDTYKGLLPKIGLILICFVFIFGYQSSLSSPSTDILPNAIVLFILLNTIFNVKSYTDSPLIYSVLAVYAVTLKLSVAPICLFFVYIIITRIKQKSYKPVVWLIVLSIVVLLPWIVRNVIITGYLIYPFPAIDIFSFDWKIPKSLVSDEKEWVLSWARMPGLGLEEYREMAGGEWLKFWLLRHIRGMKLFLLLYCIAAVSPVVIFILRKKNILKTFEDILPWLVAFCGFIFWFVLAPDGRFGLSFIIVSAIIPLFYIQLNIAANSKRIIYRTIFCMLFLFIITNVVDMFSRSKDSSKDILSYLYLPGDVRFVIDNNKTEFQIMKAGNIDVFIPDNMLCSDHSIPCAPYRVNNLEMRGEAIKDGFRIKQ